MLSNIQVILSKIKQESDYLSIQDMGNDDVCVYMYESFCYQIYLSSVARNQNNILRVHTNSKPDFFSFLKIIVESHGF